MIWPFRRRPSYRTHRNSGWDRFYRYWNIVHWLFRLVVLFLIVDLFYLASDWPDWKRLSAGAVPKSMFMQQYETKRKRKQWPSLQWQPVPFDRIPDHVRWAVIVAEDSRFYSHGGFDFIAFREAMDYNLSEGKMAFGASTISQQTTKNLFLSSSRNPLRKWHELILTWAMEKNLKKDRILELYLNIAEFGRGIYGVDAAARHYWGKPAQRLTPGEAAELAATLPSPKKHNPNMRTRQFLKRVEKISYWLERRQEGLKQ